jgi:hypothetical protein
MILTISSSYREFDFKFSSSVITGDYCGSVHDVQLLVDYLCVMNIDNIIFKGVGSYWTGAELEELRVAFYVVPGTLILRKKAYFKCSSMLTQNKITLQSTVKNIGVYEHVCLYTSGCLLCIICMYL